MASELNCSFITGLAGSGKSTGLRTRLEFEPDAFILTSTTGLSAINLGVATVNSTFHYFDTANLNELYKNKSLHNTIYRLTKGMSGVQGLAIDEVSMLDAEQLDMIYNAFEQVCKWDAMDKDLEIVLCGDFLQLPPVKAKYAFEAKCWSKFEDGMVKLDKVYRQDNILFLEALNEFRAGRGRNGVDLLKQCGVKFNDKITRFQGTTILPKNDLVDIYNNAQFADISSPIIKVPAIRTGKQTSDWKKIPDVLELKIGALVMILSNDSKYRSYANGDQGTIMGWDDNTKEFLVQILSSNEARNGKIVRISYIKREYKELKDGIREIAGTLHYMPLRLAYSSTVHKSQGLTLDKVQIDFRDKFFSNPGSMYVALSRCRTPEGLRLVGSEEMMIKRTVLNEKVRRFL